MSGAEPVVRYEKSGGVARIALDRPKSLNAVNFQLAEELYSVLVEADHDDAVRAAILTGAGKAFCGGGDLPAFRENLPHADRFLKRLTSAFHLCIQQIVRMRKPVVAAVNGAAAGGGLGLALAPDLAVAAESAKFAMAYTAIGATPDGGTTYFLQRAIGLRRAAEMTLLNRALTAREALAWGLVNEVVPDDELEDRARAVAERLAAGPTAAFAASKRLLWQGFARPLDEQMEEESRAMAASGATADFAEGVVAFLEKRKANFRGN